MAKKLSQRQLDDRADIYMICIGILMLALGRVIWCFWDNNNGMLGLLIFIMNSLATAMYLSAQNEGQSKIAAIIAAITSVVILICFSDQSKSIAFFAASKQFAMVLLAGAVSYLVGRNLADKTWQTTHPLKVGICFGATLGLPYLTGHYNFKYQDGFADICGIIAASTFGSIYLKEIVTNRNRKSR